MIVCYFSALGPRIPQVQRAYPLEVVSWGHFPGLCLGKEDRIVYAGKDVTAFQTPVFKEASRADVIVHLGCEEEKVTFKS